MDTTDQSWLETACFGGGLTVEAENYLRMASQAYAEDSLAESYLERAMAVAPDHAAVLIGYYRFYFYKGRLLDALGIARICLKKAARDNELSPDWRTVRCGDANFGSYDAILPRFYLFTLKAYGYLNMRLGHLVEGREVIMKLLELDPSDKVGSKVLLDVLDRMGKDDED